MQRIALLISGPHPRSSRALPLLLSLLLIAGAVGQSPPAAPSPKKATVAVLGASVSGGFNANAFGPGSEMNLLRAVNLTLRLDTALRPLWPASQVTIKTYADIGTFRNRRGGLRQVRRALRVQPDLVVALDLPFWFGAGSWTLEDGANETEARLAIQSRLFKTLEAIEVPLLIGDYPDITDASPRMVPSVFKPSQESLTALNASIRAWAASRPNVHVVPLAAWVAWAKEHGLTVPVNTQRAVHLKKDQLLAWDGLHPTELGIAALAHWLQPGLRKAVGDHEVLAFRPLPLGPFLGPTAAWELLPKPNRP